MKERFFSILIVIAIISGAGYWYYQYRNEKAEKQIQREQRQKQEALQELIKINKSFKYITEKISVVENINQDSVTIFYKEYLKHFKKLKFDEKNQIAGILEYKNEVPDISEKYDFVNVMKKKFHFSKNISHKIMNVIDKEETIHELYEKIWFLEMEVEELETE